ncbi:MAG: HPP family-domain-containing protein [Monoraphidium minutum]|nr:MAG: HPP family-domain-containing protein [Monoraphidium minutum]
MLRAFGRKLRGGLDHRLKVPHLTDLFVSWLGAFVGIAVVSLLDQALWRAVHFPLLVASFGASAVLLYGVPESKLAQPWNVIGGQLLSSLIGVAVRLALSGRVPWLANALGMSLALLAMQLTTTTHPPGGATALIACSAPITAPWMGFQFCITVTLGSCVMVFVAFITNNVCRDRSYPTYWF